MKKELISQLETPCIVIDVRKAKKNIIDMQKAAKENGCRLRPHIKTHKMPLFAKEQMLQGATGITCAKISEAEVMAAEGIDDIFVAYPMIGDFRIKRAIHLAKKINRLILAVDSIEGARMLEEHAKEEGCVLEVRLEVDTGLKRTGVDRSQMLSLAKEIAKSEYLNLTGIYTFKGLTLDNEPTTDREAAGIEEGKLLAQMDRDLRDAGIALPDISAGSTPTGLITAKTGLVNEIRPGTYIFNDYMLYKEGAAKLIDVAARIYSTVVSTPVKDYAVIDGGTKTFPMDIMPNTAPYYYPGYAAAEFDQDLCLLRMNEEHGILTRRTGDIGLHPGDVISFYPIHVCTAINMQNEVYLYDGETLVKEPVKARGMLV